MFIVNNLTKPCQCNYRFRTLDICGRRSVLCSCGMFRCLLSYDWWRAYSYRCWFTTLILWYVLDSQIVCISEAHFKLLSLWAVKNILQIIHQSIAVSLLVGLYPLIINSPMRKFPFNQGQQWKEKRINVACTNPKHLNYARFVQLCCSKLT